MFDDSLLGELLLLLQHFLAYYFITFLLNSCPKPREWSVQIRNWENRRSWSYKAWMNDCWQAFICQYLNYLAILIWGILDKSLCTISKQVGNRIYFPYFSHTPLELGDYAFNFWTLYLRNTTWIRAVSEYILDHELDNHLWYSSYFTVAFDVLVFQFLLRMELPVYRRRRICLYVPP